MTFGLCDGDLAGIALQTFPRNRAAVEFHDPPGAVDEQCSRERYLARPTYEIIHENSENKHILLRGDRHRNIELTLQFAQSDAPCHPEAWRLFDRSHSVRHQRIC